MTQPGMAGQLKVAFVYGVRAGTGGLGLQAATALTGLAEAPNAAVHAFGPGPADEWPLPQGLPEAIWHTAPKPLPAWSGHYTWLRWYQGQQQFLHDVRLGRWAGAGVAKLGPDACYTFTQVGLETLRWAKRAGVASVLDSPNGHIRNFGAVYRRESLRWCKASYVGHPTEAMMSRVEEEYELAERIRVSSAWAKESLTAHGVPRGKIEVIPQTLDVERFRPPAEPPPATGALRVCYVGSLDLRKGFVYLLGAARLAGASRVRLTVGGSTGDRCSRRLLESERSGLEFEATPGNPLPVYHGAEIFVLPSLEDGFGFVVAEAMACGLPVIVTEECGAKSWVRPGATGWVVPAGDASALASALEEAIERRDELAAMGRAARADVLQFANARNLSALREWFYDGR